MLFAGVGLKNDQQALTEELDALLQQYFSATASSHRQRESPEAASSRTRLPPEGSHEPQPPQSVQRQPKRPFAVGTGSHVSCTSWQSNGTTHGDIKFSIMFDLANAVDQVASGSPANQAGMMQGDRIFQFGEAVTDLPSLAKQVMVSRIDTMSMTV